LKSKTYEAMFLLNPTVVSDWSAGEAEIRRLLERAEARVLGLKRWDERKLAYEIDGHKRGLFGLVFFEANGDKIGDLERDARLSEAVLRLLVLRAEGLTQERIDKALAAAAPPRTMDRGDPWSGSGGRDRRGGERFGGERHGGPRERAAAEPEATGGSPGAARAVEPAEAR